MTPEENKPAVEAAEAQESGPNVPEMVETFTYKVVAEAKNPLDSVIEKEGTKVRFTLADIKRDEERAIRFKKELEAQIAIENAKIDNVSRNHPIVTTLDPVQLTAAGVYAEAEKLKKACEAKLGELDELFAAYAKEKEDIYRQIGVAFPVEEPKATEESQVKEL